jgi:putative oxidoreductase
LQFGAFDNLKQRFMKKLLSTRYSETSLSIALFILRAAAGAMMIPHGYDKLQHFSKYSPAFVDPFHIGITASLSLDIFAEFFCSILLILGLLARLTVIPLIIAMSVALFYVHHGEIFGDGERAALYLIMFISILFAGPGKFSIDGMISK